MVANPAPASYSLPLLMPPDKPMPGKMRSFGWRWAKQHWYQRCKGVVPGLERRLQDDAKGAVVQWCVLRHFRDGVLRKQLACEHGMCERQIQHYLSGQRNWGEAYAAPVLRALQVLGIPTGGACHSRLRADVQLAASRAALLVAAELLTDDSRLEARRLCKAVRLLTIDLAGSKA